MKTTAGATLKTEIKAFDRRGNCISETDGEGNLFTRTYDGLNRVRTETGPSGIRSFKEECTWITSLAEARAKISTYIHYYNHRRPHQALNYPTPNQYHQKQCPIAA